MKKLAVTIFVLLFVHSSALSAPYSIDLSNEPSYVIDGSYNLELRKKLNEAFDKKYIIERTKHSTVYSYPTNAYDREVLAPYYELRKSTEQLIEEQYLNKKNN